MTTPEASSVGPAESVSSPPTAARLFVHTNWAALKHALPGQVDLADALAKLLAVDGAARARALSDVQQAVHHQNTIYPATTTVALYIAALLSDPCTESVSTFGRDERPRQLRAALLDWLGEMADDVSDGSIAAGQRFGLGISPEQAELRSARPGILAATMPFTNASDVDVRHAAVTTVLLLLDTAMQRIRHQIEYEPLVEEILANSANHYHRARALDSLDAWGRNTTIIRQEQSTHADTGTDGSLEWSSQPPF